jgi:hypothetical protein
MTMEYAPVCIFAYKRYDSLKTVVENLRANYLAEKTELFICSNAAVDDSEKEIVNNIRNYALSISGFKQVTLIKNEINNGPTEHFLKSITRVVMQYKKIIILNDDDVPTKNFLNYMNEALVYYENIKKTFSVGAYAFFVPRNYFGNTDICFIPRPGTWGMGIWADRWQSVLECKFIKEDIKQTRWFQYNRGGYDLFNISMTHISGSAELDVKLIYTMYTNKLLTIFPKNSFITNIGFDGTGQNCRMEDKDKYMPSLVNPEKTDFVFTDQIVVNKKIARCYRKFYGGFFYFYIIDNFPLLYPFLRKIKRAIFRCIGK